MCAEQLNAHEPRHEAQKIDDFYHSHACFWAVEDGLFRTDMNDPTAPFVFPKLHELRVTEWHQS